MGRRQGRVMDVHLCAAHTGKRGGGSAFRWQVLGERQEAVLLQKTSLRSRTGLAWALHRPFLLKDPPQKPWQASSC